MMKLQICALMIFIFFASTVSGQTSLSIGDKAPEFKAEADNGSTWDVKNFLGKKYVVVYFYPAAMSTGCTKEACSYRDHIGDLNSADVVVVGVSGDNIKNLKLFKEAEKLNFTLLSDSKGVIAKTFGVPVSEGGTFKSVIGGVEHELARDLTEKRWTFIIGKDKKIIYKNESVDPEKNAEEVLSFIKHQESKS